MRTRLAFGVILPLLPIELASEYMFVCLLYIHICCIAGIEKASALVFSIRFVIAILFVQAAIQAI